MRFQVEELTVDFPYPRIYPEQYQYMLELKRSLDARGHSMLEMPTGTGKTITLLSLITSYQRAHPDMGKLIYCTRTIPEMEKVLEELKGLEAARDTMIGETRPRKLLAVGLSSRRNLCVHERVSQHAEKQQVDQECRQLTAPWVRQRAGVGGRDKDGQPEGSSRGRKRGRAAGVGGAGGSGDAMDDGSAPGVADVEDMGGGGGGCCSSGGAGSSSTYELAPRARGDGEDAPLADSSVELCEYYEALERQGTDALLASGVHTLEELKALGKGKGWCPYFLARHVIAFADVVVYNYQYLLDPKISQLVSKSMQRECVVVFDEAHNIDNICIEVMSINFRMPTLEACTRNLGRISSELSKMKATDSSRLREEYARLVHGLAQSGTLPMNAELASNPVLPDDILTQVRHLPVSPHISPHLPVSPRISPHLPVSTPGPPSPPSPASSHLLPRRSPHPGGARQLAPRGLVRQVPSQARPFPQAASAGA